MTDTKIDALPSDVRPADGRSYPHVCPYPAYIGCSGVLRAHPRASYKYSGNHEEKRADAMRFMILIYSSHASEAAIHADAHDDFREKHNAVISELSASGELVETRELSVIGAKIVSTRNGLSIVDGPYVGVEDWVSGYYLVNVADEKRVHDIAARFVEARYATVETRRLE